MEFVLLEQAVLYRLRHIPDQGEIELRTIINRRTERIKNTCPCVSVLGNRHHQLRLKLRLRKHACRIKISNFFSKFSNPFSSRQNLG